MLIIIDGYNLLKQLIKADFATEKQRQSFINFMVQYAHKRHHHVIIVFDGGGYSRPTAVKKGQVNVVFSGIRETADDYIKHILPEFSSRQALVVSSDKTIALFAEKYSIPALDSLFFYRLIQEKLEQAPLRILKTVGPAHKIIKQGEKSNRELDLLMQEGSMLLLYKDTENNSITPKALEATLSKKEKKLESILKKL